MGEQSERFRLWRQSECFRWVNRVKGSGLDYYSKVRVSEQSERFRWGNRVNGSGG